ncbi:MAG TPA: hypothetical protein VGR07_08920 [Thermoanaerobaculia bacterium]|jgi:hypothetical protein|nr:hypothetical protein [Thermoanaerobaculia bacterium]
MERMKVAHFTVSANVEQSARWKQAAECAGHRSVGTWLAEAADCYMKAKARAGIPLALSWRRSGRFPVVMEDGEEVEMTGMVSPPFGIFRGNGGGGKAYEGSRAYSLVYVPERRILATFRFADKCRALASELAPTLLRGLSPGEPGGIVERYRRETA